MTTALVPVTIHVEVPPPVPPDNYTISGFCVQELGGKSYPFSADFLPGQLDDAVECWGDQGLDRCQLRAFAEAPGRNEESLCNEVKSDFCRTNGWSSWEEI